MTVRPVLSLMIIMIYKDGVDDNRIMQRVMICDDDRNNGRRKSGGLCKLFDLFLFCVTCEIEQKKQTDVTKHHYLFYIALNR